ncbi:hypothetical protein EJB05_18060 [Eragrostis curvula]|uniref:RecA family profile 2 domain-containing protein n=1 Tax=Eragrostis curvula TaxID=38414 RepID=A0A5J9VJ17_9POAL|nr:hypothetical protein EJB05_18060 [Eragrostis curvula]
MATLLRRATLRRAFAAAASSSASSHPESYRQGICGSTFHYREFSSKAKKKKSSGTDSGEENMSKKDLALHQAIDQITSAFGKGAIMWLGRSQGHREVPVISTGSIALDMALGTGGLPKGRVIEVFGPEASGKTTLALHVIAEAQKSGGYCAFVDAEHALDPALAESIGVDTNNLLLSQPDCAEQALSLVDTLIRSGSVDVVVVDSVAALVPKTELDGDMGDAHVALQARLMSQALRKLSHSLSLSQTILLFINQIRSKVATFGFGGPTEVTSGGNALKFYASVRLNIKRIGLVKKGEETIGSQVAVKIVKNKHAPPFKTANFELEFGKGISRSSELIEFGLKHKLVQKAGGAYYGFNDLKFCGKEALKSYLANNESTAKELEMTLRQLMETEATKEEAEDVSPNDLPEEILSPETSSEEEVAAVVEA